MRNAVVVGVALCAVACSRDRSKQTDEPGPTETSLEQRYAAKVRELDPTLRVEIAGELEVRVYASGSDSPVISYLDNLSRLCLDSPTTCDEDIARYARNALQSVKSASQDPAPVDLTRVRAVLKDDVYMEQTHALLNEKFAGADGGSGFEMAARRFVGDLWIVYVEDSPESMRMLRTDDLPEMKLDADGLHLLAMKNMREALPDIPYVKSDEVPNVWGVATGDSYDAARMILHERWKPILDVVEGDLVVAVPTRDFIMFTGTGHPEAIEVIREVSQQAQEDAYALSAKLYRWTANGWVVHQAR